MKASRIGKQSIYLSGGAFLFIEHHPYIDKISHFVFNIIINLKDPGISNLC